MSARMYFLAILAPHEVNLKVLEWKYYMREHFGCVVAMRSPAHITLVPPFWMDEQLEVSLREDVQQFCGEQKPFKVELEDFDAFKPKVIFLHVKPTVQLESLRSELERNLLSKGKYPIKAESRSFHPHITIANRDLLRKDFLEAFGHFKKIAYKQTFMTNEVAILKHERGEWNTIGQSKFNDC
jgi:2'-5' RNA ligase